MHIDRTNNIDIAGLNSSVKAEQQARGKSAAAGGEDSAHVSAAAEFAAKALSLGENIDAAAVAKAKALLAEGKLDSDEAIAQAARDMIERGM